MCGPISVCPANLSFATEVKHGSKKTNPNISVTGINDDYMYVKSLNFELGRISASVKLNMVPRLLCWAKKVYDALYENNEDFNGPKYPLRELSFG